MGRVRRAEAVVGVVLALLMVAVAVAEAKPKGRRAKLYRAGEVFCTSHALVWGTGSVVIRDRCYVIGLLRSRDGTFLAFLDPAAPVPPGQLVRLNTPAGAKLRGRIFYLVPVQTVVAVPLDTLVVVPMRVEEDEGRVTVILTGPRAPNLTVVFSVRL